MYVRLDPLPPLHSGAHAHVQVYKARVRHTGALVAVKVQRPDAFSSAAVDMYLLR